MNTEGAFTCVCPANFTGPFCSITVGGTSQLDSILPIAVPVVIVVAIIGLIIVIVVIIIARLGVPAARKHHTKRHDSYSPAQYEQTIERERLI